MTHIHIPDGILPIWLVLAGWAIAAAGVGLASSMAARSGAARKVPLVGAVAALMLVSMSSEIVPIAYHINLTVLAGILLGPWLSIIAAFVVDIVLALIGHGGVTVIGLNTIVVSAEMIVGWALFRGAVALLGRRRAPWVAATATVLTLALSTLLLVGVVALGGVRAASRESGAFDPLSGRFGPVTQGPLFTNTVVTPGGGEETLPPLSVERFATMVFILGPLGWMVEAAVTGAIVGLVARVRPSLVFDGAEKATGRVIPGDEGVAH